MYYTYILESKLYKRYYIGSTEDLKRRLNEHNAGKTTSTKPYKPWDVVYYEAHKTKTLAKQAEIFYKSSQGRRHIKKKLGIS